MGEKTARKIRWRIRFCPSNAVQNAEIQLIQHLRNRKNIVIRATNPDCAVILQMRAAGRKPFAVKIIVLFKTLRLIPVALVHAHLLPRLNRNCSRAFPSLRSDRAIRGYVRTSCYLHSYATLRNGFAATTIPNAISFLKLFKVIVKISNSSKNFFKYIIRNRNIFQIISCHFALRTTCFYRNQT